jgi:hypothetical protein
MRVIRPYGSEGGAGFNSPFLPLSLVAALLRLRASVVLAFFFNMTTARNAFAFKSPCARVRNGKGKRETGEERGEAAGQSLHWRCSR